MSAKRKRPTAGSSIVPRMQSESMLKSRWKKPACRKPAVRSRQYSPSATVGARRPRLHEQLAAAEPAAAGGARAAEHRAEDDEHLMPIRT